MRGIVPSQVLSRKDKIGFVCPESQIKELMLIDFKQIKPIQIFRTNKIDKNTDANELWRILNFSIWCNLNAIYI